VVFAIGINLYTRVPLKVDVIRDRASLSRDVDGRWVENIYQLQIMNTQEVAHRFIIHASGAETLQVADARAIEIPGASTRMVPVRLRVDKGRLPLGSHNIEFEITAADNAAIVARERSIFLVR
jgi:polyferredoxin